MKLLTIDQVIKKYKNKYIYYRKHFEYDTMIQKYEVFKAYNTIHENTNLVTETTIKEL